ncbi:GAF domain-containing protein [uncultured Pseudophaeobacter sp.]|jgi:hypothetical protein|uniref:GAF domain-containing protein n=1 Tax=uncultured Pseudophaeobacter sp. TaxID=1759421 RepID=UPI0025EECB04|nr:GAF domain-containing protein [uncultured Pseudophaeobacter sp.]
MQQLASPVNEWKNQGSSDELLVLSSSTGRDFIQFFAETLADCFEIDLVTIGELLVMENERISVLAGSMDGKPLEDFDYQACLTPCIAVIKTAQPKILLSDVQKSYTEDNLLREQGIRSYIGIPLKNSEGELIGVVQASWRREIDPEEAEHVLETIDMFVARLSAELVTLHAMRILAALAEGPSLIGNLDTLRLLTEQMQTALKVRVAFIAETLPEDDHSFRLLTYCQDGKLIPDVENEIVPYAGTPCTHLKDKDVFIVRTELQEAFPTQMQYKEANLVSYLGQNIRDESGQVIGHFALQHDRELLDKILQADLFKLFSARLNLELRKFHAEQHQRDGGETHPPTMAQDAAGKKLPPALAQSVSEKLAALQDRVAGLEKSLENGPAPQVPADLKALQAELVATQKLLSSR